MMLFPHIMRCGSMNFPLNQSIPAHTKKIINTDTAAYPKVHNSDDPKCPVQSTVSFQSHVLIASELACINNTPKVAPPIALIKRECGIFRSLKYMKDVTATNRARILLQSEIKKCGLNTGIYPFL